jgi:cob(I)alamin adenosyltransferase
MKLERYTQISTKSGDKGHSSNYNNQRFRKDDLLFDTIGTIDELSSLLGIVYHYSKHGDLIKRIQLKLQHINSLIATTKQEMFEGLNKVTEEDIRYLEEQEQALLETVTIERMFVLPGSEGSKESAYLQLARAVTRRAERHLVRFVYENDRHNLDDALRYLNRLSDLLFILASKK